MNIGVKIECGFLNDKIPVTFLRRPIFICLLAERSDGFLIDFRRIRYGSLHIVVVNSLNFTPYSAKNFNNEDVHLKVELIHHGQYVTCYVMCDEIGVLKTDCRQPCRADWKQLGQCDMPN